MPFAIVEASEENDGKELFVVPEGWLLDTEQTNTILLWPKCDGPKLYKLLTDGESVANTKWMKMDCIVKEINIPNLSVAHDHVLKMNGEFVETQNTTELSATPIPLTVDCSNVQNEDDTSKKEARPVQKVPMTCDIDFKQIDCLESLENLNDKLLETAYQDKIYEWLNGQITEVKSENRMTEAIDLLFTKRFMTKCSWTGVGRGSEKIAMMRMVNISKLFRRIGTNESTIVNQRMVMMFFMKKLRNAVRRSEMKHLRKSTSHNVPSHKVKAESQ
uniref:DUF4806 domain-containing protein n=1 Tax=Anopheles christyi TaxID=43041 RepID=A0A182K5D1_9DIPT